MKHADPGHGSAAESFAVDAAVPVLVVDDHASFRSVAHTVVSLSPGFVLAGEAGTGEDAVVAAAGLGPHLVLMDINLPGISGIEATRRITAGRTDVVVVLLSTYTQGDLPDDAHRCGAATYVHKEDVSPAVLRRAWDDAHG